MPGVFFCTGKNFCRRVCAQNAFSICSVFHAHLSENCIPHICVISYIYQEPLSAGVQKGSTVHIMGEETDDVKGKEMTEQRKGGINMIYLDNAATSFPKPASVTDAVTECMTEWCANPGRSGHEMAMKSAEAVYRARIEAAGLIGAGPDEIVFTQNCTGALNIALHGVLRPGDHVVTTMMEHNSVLRPLNAMRRYGVKTTVVRCGPDGRLSAESVRRACRDNTRMIVCTMASNVTGTVMPTEEIGEIAAEKRILFLADGSQAAGVLETDVESMKADFLAVSGHKSLMGPQGTGFLYIRHGTPVFSVTEGGTGSESESIVQPQTVPEGMEAGTLNVPGITGLAEGIRFVKKTGLPEIRKKEENLIGYLSSMLEGRKNIISYGPEKSDQKVGIFAFNIRGMNSETTAEILDRQYGIAVRAGFHCAPFAHRAIGTQNSGCVRISVGMFNTEKEISDAAEAILDIAEIAEKRKNSVKISDKNMVY